MLGIDAIVKLTPELIEYLLTSKYAQNGLGDKMVEIVTRDAKGKYAKFTKCLLPNLTQTTQTLSSVTTTFSSAFAPIIAASSLANNVQTEMVRRAVKEVGKDVKTVLNGVNMLKSIGWVTMGLSATNIGISIAGFAVMDKKLNAMDRKINDIQAKIDEIGKQVNEIHRMSIESNFFRPVNSISLKSKQITSKIANGEKVSREDIDSLLQEICINVRSFLALSYIIPIEDMLEILYTILPIAVNMIDLYYTDYYEYTGENGHSLHSTLSQLIGECSGDVIRTQIEDRYYLEYGCHSKMVDSILDCNDMICRDLKLKMEDTLLLRKGCDTKEHFDELNEVTSKLAAAMVLDLIPLVEQDQGAKKAIEILNQTAEQTLGMKVAMAV